MTEYHSIEFQYSPLTRGGGYASPSGSMVFVHVQFTADPGEIDLLGAVETAAYNAARTVGLRLYHEYSYPDGSCYKYAVTETREEFVSKFEKLRRILASPWMSMRVDPRYRRVDGNSEAGPCHLTLSDRIAGRPLYYDTTFEPQEPRTSWGGLSQNDWRRYREHHAFKDGLLAAFGHSVNFWNGGPAGYAPTVKAQELAGVGYHLGLLFKLLFYSEASDDRG